MSRQAFDQREPGLCLISGCVRLAEHNLDLMMGDYPLTFRICRVHQREVSEALGADFAADPAQMHMRPDRG
jgi:hypothetical protein